MDFLKGLFSKEKKDSFALCYTCDGCLKVIEDGNHRFNCVECVESYDLCKKCMRNGKGTEHAQNCGSGHTFVMETQPFPKISKLVFSATSLEELVLNMFNHYKARQAIGQYDGSTNSFKFLTFGEILEMVTLFSGGLQKLVAPMACSSDVIVSMCSMPRLEWYLSDLACLFLGYTTVPLNTTGTKDQMKYIVNKADSTVLVCSSKMLEDNLTDILSGCPSLKLVVLMDIALTSPKKLNFSVQAPSHVQLIRFSEVMTVGKKLQVINFSKIKHDPAKMFTVQFTSGSTGDPKGCVFTRATWKTRIAKNSFMGYLPVWLSYHPLSHNLERKSFYVTLLNGGKIGIYRGAMEHLFDDFALLRPTIVASTPRLWTSLYNEYLKVLYEAFSKHKANASTLEGAAIATEEMPEQISVEHFDPDQVPAEIVVQVMSQFKSRLGGRERMVTTGGAATDPAVLKFIIHCFKGMVNDGYGSTEVGGIASDGLLFDSNDVKLIDVPEMGYFTTDNPPRGEISIKTPEMIDRYFKDPEVTAKKFVDGYFLTGDIGMVDSSGKITIIDRKKNIFKLSQGEFVSPESLENLYSGASHLIDQIYVYGSSLHSNVIAVVVPDRESIFHIARSMGKDENDLSILCKMDEINDIFLKELQTIARKNSLPGWEVPVGIILGFEPFTSENNLLTSTMKANRPMLEKKYKNALEGLYAKVIPSVGQSLEISIFEKIKSTIMKQKSGELQQLEDGSMLEKSFSQLGGDSLSAMQLSSLLREHLHLDVPAEVILKDTLYNIVISILNKSGKLIGQNYSNFGVSNFPNWTEEASSKEFLAEVMNDPRNAMDCTVMETASCVLLTGGTGFLGRFVLSELLLDPHITKVYCLVKKKDDIPPGERLLKMIQQLSVETGNNRLIEESAKMTVVVGNLSEDSLGLSSEDYDTLLESVDTIIHNGAVVNSALPYSVLKSTNVNSTKELIKMAMLVRPKFLHFVSTIGVYPFMVSRVDETVKPPIERLNELSGYSQSKWVAESLVLSAIEGKKIRGNVCRPGLIGPHNVTGHANLQDWVCWVIKGFIRLGTMPSGQGCEDKVIHWVPVDQVARAIVYLGCKSSRGQSIENSIDTIHHLTNSNSPVTVSSLTDSLAEKVSSIQALDYDEFRRLLAERVKLTADEILGKTDILLPRKGGWPVSQVSYSQGHKIKQLEEAGINLDYLAEGYVDNYLNYILHH